MRTPPRRRAVYYLTLLCDSCWGLQHEYRAVPYKSDKDEAGGGSPTESSHSSSAVAELSPATPSLARPRTQRVLLLGAGLVAGAFAAGKRHERYTGYEMA